MARASRRRAVAADDADDGPRIERRPSGWRIRSYAAARQVLQARGATTQAGFTAEFIPTGYLDHHPILISDGHLHDEQRRKVGRFFAPAVVRERYRPHMVACADALVARAVAAGGAPVDELALLYSVEVTGRVVGLTHAPVDRMARRLEAFFRQPPFDIEKPDLGRSRQQWARAAWNALGPLLSFYLADVRPAVRARRRERAEDVISHLVDEGYTDRDILVECLTYGTAGMVTTRELIAMALWHLLGDPGLRADYQAGDETARFAILEELVRVEPVVGHLYRRVSEAFTIRDGEQEWDLTPGDLVDLRVRDTNTDAEVFGDDAMSICPVRHVPRGVHAAGLSFGDGAHRCPGQPLAIMETEVLLTRLLAQDPVIVRSPTLGWDDLVAGYTLRDFRVRLRGDQPSAVTP